MSSTASVIMYTAAIAFGFGMLLVSPVSHNTMQIVVLFSNCCQIRYLAKKILPRSGEGPSEE